MDDLGEGYRECARCEERDYRINNPKSIITGYGFDYYFEKFNDNKNYDYIDHFKDDNKILFKSSNNNNKIIVYEKHLVFFDLKNNAEKNISYDMEYIDEYYNIKNISLENNILYISFTPIIIHPRTIDTIYYKLSDIEENKISSIIENLIEKTNKVKEYKKNQRKFHQ